MIVRTNSIMLPSFFCIACNECISRSLSPPCLIKLVSIMKLSGILGMGDFSAKCSRHKRARLFKALSTKANQVSSFASSEAIRSAPCTLRYRIIESFNNL